MSDLDELRRENRALRDRTAMLSAAMLRISESLDVEMVLHEIVESARALTDARYGVITTVDAEGEMEDFVTSGLTAEEHRQMAEWPDGPRLLRYLRDLPAPLRVGDVSGFLESLGLSTKLWGASTLQITPMYYRGEHLGNFFLSDKRDGEEFTSEDEEVLVLFASQAAAAIANARAYRDESRTRADLEALIDASPVGVAVLDARTGRAVSFNREAQRIVEGLRAPGQAPEDLLKTMTGRFPDGREFAIDEASLARELRVGRRVRAEEIELSVPDGRSTNMLINTTPIRSDDEQGRIDGHRDAGSSAAGGAGAVAYRIPQPGQSRVAGAADLDQGIDHDRANGIAGVGSRRAACVLPHYRRAGGPHARTHRRSPRCRTHRDGHSVGEARILRGGRAGGPGEEYVSQRRRPNTPSWWTCLRACLPSWPTGGASSRF